MERNFSYLKHPPAQFWFFLEQLVARSTVVVDRVKGSRHPRYPEMVYPVDYGYLEDTTSMDGAGIDVWVGSLDDQVLNALIFTVDLKKRDIEVKLLLGCSDQEKQTILDFLNSNSMGAILVRRDADHLELLRTRRSIRHFTPKAIPGDVLTRVLEAATWAPSAHHRQPWRFAVLTSFESRVHLAEAMGIDFLRDLLEDGLSSEEAMRQVTRSRNRIHEAPAAVVLCLDPSLGDDYSDPDRRQAEYWMAVQSVAMAGENLLLAAHAQGLGGVWMCAPLFVPDTVRRALELPAEWHPQAMLLLGYPERIPAPRPRRALAEITRFF